MTRFLLVEAERPISRSVPGDIVACDEMLEGWAMQRVAVHPPFI